MRKSHVYARYSAALLTALPSLGTSASAAVPQGDSLTPWVILPAAPSPHPIRIAVGSYASVQQPAVPGKVVRLNERITLDGIELRAGIAFALTVSVADKAQAWCVLPDQAFAGRPKAIESVWGGSIGVRHFTTAWGGSTRCIADADNDGVFDTQLDGKFDSLGLPSIRRLSRATPLPAPVHADKADPRTVDRYSIAATVIYSDVSGTYSRACMSLVPSEIRKTKRDVAKRLSAITLLRNDGTACYANLDNSLYPSSPGQLAATPGTPLVNRGARVVVQQIDHDSVQVVFTSLFDPFVVATRTEREFVGY